MEQHQCICGWDDNGNLRKIEDTCPIHTMSNQDLELALSYAQDIVDFWPKMTVRTSGQMTNKINALREALELAKR